MGPEHIGYLIRVFVADTEEKAQELGHNFFWQNGALGKQPREWIAPPGYATVDVAGIRRVRAVSKPFDSQAYQEAQDNYQVVLGTPETGRSRRCATCATRWASATCACGRMDGHMSHEDTVRCIELLGREVLPALRADQVAGAGAGSERVEREPAARIL